MRLHQKLHPALLADFSKQLGQHRLGQRVQMDLGLFEQHRAAGRHAVGHREHRQHLRHTHPHVAQVGSHAILVHQQFVAAGAPQLAHLDAVGQAHALQPRRHVAQHRALPRARLQGIGQQGVDGLLALGPHRARTALVPHLVARRPLAQRAQVNNGLQLAAQGQAQVLQMGAIGAQQGNGLGRECNRALGCQVRPLAAWPGFAIHPHRIGPALPAHSPKLPRHGGQRQRLHHHGAAGRLAIAAGKAALAHAFALGALELQHDLELARRHGAMRQHGVKIAQADQVVGLVAPQVQVHRAIRRRRGLLEQQQALQQGGFARRVAAQQHGDRRQPHAATVAPGLEVLELQVLDHVRRFAAPARQVVGCGLTPASGRFRPMRWARGRKVAASSPAPRPWQWRQCGPAWCRSSRPECSPAPRRRTRAPGGW